VVGPALHLTDFNLLIGTKRHQTGGYSQDVLRGQRVRSGMEFLYLFDVEDGRRIAWMTDFMWGALTVLLPSMLTVAWLVWKS
jgi:hypothetical protein